MNDNKQEIARLLLGAAQSVNDRYYADEMLLDTFDDNYYGEGSIVIGNTEHTIESIWTGKNVSDNPALMLHINSDDFEGDVEYNTISPDNQRRVIAMLRKHYEIDVLYEPCSNNPNDLDLVGLELKMNELFPDLNWQNDILSDIICDHDLQDEYLERMRNKIVEHQNK